jgi:hypothetical protein
MIFKLSGLVGDDFDIRLVLAANPLELYGPFGFPFRQHTVDIIYTFYLLTVDAHDNVTWDQFRFFGWTFGVNISKKKGVSPVECKKSSKKDDPSIQDFP